MSTACIILNYNTGELTARLARKLSLYDSIDKIILVDNCSKDNSLLILNGIKDRKIDVIKADYNGGYSYGNNFGISYLKQNYRIEKVIICNPDIEIDKEDLDKVLAALDKYPEFGIITAVEYNIRGEVDEPILKQLNTYHDDLMDCFYMGRLLRRKRKTVLDTNKEFQKSELFRGSFLAVRLEDYLKSGGFDNEVFLFCEERILARKMASIGKSIGIVMDAKYYHNHSTSINQEYRKHINQIKLYYNARLYYNITYNRIGVLKKTILRWAMNFSLFEYRISELLQTKSK